MHLTDKSLNMLIAVASGIVLGALTLWFVQFALQTAREHDANPRRANFKNQMMRRKAAAMDHARHAIIRGNLAQVNAAAGRMKESASTIDRFLSTEVYNQYGADFHRSTQDLLAATAENDRDGSKEAFLRLERSCIECHFLINQPE